MSILIRPARFDLPASPEQLFGRTGHVAVEVGIGNGLFIAALAAAYPSWNVVGVELAPASVTRAFRRLRREGAANARLFMGHAHFFMRTVAAPRSLDRVYVNFPDPWPRPKHRHKRFLQAPFFRILSSRLADGGMLLFTTDHEGYFHDAAEQARVTGLYRVEPGPPPPETLQTKYARKWKRRGGSFFHARIVKTGEAPSAEPAIDVLADMHHAVLEGPLPDLDAFETHVAPFGGGHVILREAYRALDGEGLLFLVRVEEEELAQEVVIEARPGKHGFFVGLKRFGEPLYTRGVSAAVHAAATWLEAHGMTVKHRRY